MDSLTEKDSKLYTHKFFIKFQDFHRVPGAYYYPYTPDR